MLKNLILTMDQEIEIKRKKKDLMEFILGKKAHLKKLENMIDSKHFICTIEGSDQFYSNMYSIKFNEQEKIKEFLLIQKDLIKEDIEKLELKYSEI